MKRWIRLGIGFGKQMSRANVNAYASSCAFFIFLSLIPILMLICGVLPYTPLKQSNLMQAANQVVPVPMQPLVMNLILTVYNTSAGVIGAAALVLVWSAGKGVLALMRGLNAMNGVIEDRNYVVQRIIASFYTVVMLAVMIFALIVMVFGNVLAGILVKYVPALEELFAFLLRFKILFAWLVLSFFFTLIYTYLPNRKLRLKNQIPGAVFTAVAWNIFSWAFSVYVEKFNGFSMYGSLTTIVMVMLWLYICIYLLLVGAHINRFATSVQPRRYPTRRVWM